ncbi:MAG: hypothetical protein PW786_10525 [Arachidicoccus sp.]|nr:hypothetical protein [Arachidicoccus sp.]
MDELSVQSMQVKTDVEVIKNDTTQMNGKIVKSVDDNYKSVKSLTDKVTIPVMHEWKLYLFSHWSQSDIYKSIYKNLFKWLTILVISLTLIFIINYYIKEDFQPCKQAWQELYNGQDKKHQEFLEKLFNSEK